MKWPGSAGFAVAVALAAGLAVTRGGGRRRTFPPIIQSTCKI